jgi:hypothetical protein
MESHLKDLTLLPFSRNRTLTTVTEVREISNEPFSGPLLHYGV